MPLPIWHSYTFYAMPAAWYVSGAVQAEARDVWRTAKGVAQWPGNSEAHKGTITVVSDATGACTLAASLR